MRKICLFKDVNNNLEDTPRSSKRCTSKIDDDHLTAEEKFIIKRQRLERQRDTIQIVNLIISFKKPKT
jgi:hypothetical protein